MKVPGVKISCMAQPLAFMVTKDREAYLKERPEREGKRVCGFGYDLLVLRASLRSTCAVKVKEVWVIGKNVMSKVKAFLFML